MQELPANEGPEMSARYPKLAALSASLPDPIGPQDCTDENRQAVECYRELMALRAQGWRPIAEAPKDGTVILLRHSFSTLSGFSSKNRPYKTIAIGYHDRWWITGVPGGHSAGGDDHQFTHWAPLLPAPPNERAK